MDRWTPLDEKAALAESWLLSERDDGYYQIQRFDGGDVPWTDDEALHYVASQKGSPIHEKACFWHGLPIP